MTKTTTAAKPTPPRPPGRSNRLWTVLVGGSIVIHVVLFFVLQPWGRTLLEMPAEEETSKAAAQAEQREAERQERAREARQQIALQPEQAEQLQEQIERKKKLDAQAEAEKLEDTREQIQQMRDEAFEQLKQREVTEVIHKDLPKIQRDLEAVRRRVGELIRDKAESTSEVDQKIKEKLSTIETMVEDLVEKPQPTADDASTLTESLLGLHRDLEEVEDTARDESDQDRKDAARRADKATVEAVRTAVGLKEKISDIEAFNSTKTAQSTGPQPEPDEALSGSDQQAETNKGAQPADAAGSETRAATDASPGSTTKPTSANSSLADSYDKARAAEQQARQAYADLRTAELAVRNNVTFKQAQAQVGQAMQPTRPDLSDALGQNTAQTVGDLNAYRQAVDAAGQQISDMATRTDSLLAQAAGLPMAQGNQVLDAVTGRQSMSLNVEIASGTETANSFSRGLDRGEEVATTGRAKDALDAGSLADSSIVRDALPGRMFTNLSDRRGWLYLDTWYFIGPWLNNGDPEFDRARPPEAEINLDARYTDGRFADQPGHPDQVLTWHFIQSDEVRIQPHRSYGKATYFAYTEVYFAQAREMVLAFGADAAGRIWVNDKLIWQDDIRSRWQLVEGFKTVRFEQGYNRVLVRLMNGTTEASFSVLLCPPEVVEALEAKLDAS